MEFQDIKNCYVKSIWNSLNNEFKDSKASEIATARTLTTNYLIEAQNTDFVVQAIAIPRECIVPAKTGTGIWIANIKNTAKIFIPSNFVYDQDKTKPTVLIALPLKVNGKFFTTFYREKGAQRSSYYNLIKTYFFLLRVNIFYYIAKGKEKIKQQAKKAKEIWNKTENWVKKLFKKDEKQAMQDQASQKTNKNVSNYQKSTESIVEELDYISYLKEFFNPDHSNLQDEHIFEFTEEELECLKSAEN
ncbi:hypothetical protein [Mycoplasma capricolum]|uniref:Uncharacterized protein n=1 Tax=Mycoplasma capricolum subsp. capricolum (strain California kid / ATCC 27343 / NCTC 10154) TaxID=340047 RepID=Q2SSK3_MYCCT|nr:hypothetical protein [Mycoplasma capricolum]ABC01763.1 hypothetical protein MCAP_0274 [Mycoplasma capricolum subsp. capricolum ATCC 27343]